MAKDTFNIDLLDQLEVGDVISDTGLDKPLDTAPAVPPTKDEQDEDAKKTAEEAEASAAAKAKADEENEGKTDEEIEAEQKAAAEEKRKKEEEEEEEENEQNKPDNKNKEDKPTTIIDQVKERLGYEIEGDFENDVDGLVDLTQKAIPKAAEQMVAKMFEEYPEAEDLINHLSQGLSTDTWKQNQEVKNILNVEITEEDVDTQKEIMVQKFTADGFTPEDAMEMVDTLEEKNKLYATSKATLKKQQELVSQQLEQKKAQETERQKTQKKNAQEHWDEIRKTIDTGKLQNLTIPQSKQTQFWDYLTKPVKDDTGNPTTQAKLNLAKLNPAQRLELEYIVFSNFKIRGVGSSKSQSLESLAAANKSRENRLKGQGGNDNRGGDDVATSNLDGVDKNYFFN
jgi:hypothetical protein